MNDITQDPRILAHIGRLVAAAPPLSAEQVDGLRLIWHGPTRIAAPLTPTMGEGQR
ncbi:hypothetical protein GCM10010112_94280 [Actinoplanes lobatus]|uniref:Uncharacterized protein n=1 Tax=Actinoplanes lobatus TaxID=113568 RepID=A0A7W7HEP0_9ACTN|nr:hypothetical protein [Actinoplanes lobatus]MBB4749173.1 hypothetical protein [Actinoplanes lobatus]GGO00006.1 hypothetical protein GCM10010112_94280 [Actinoplanes lobatus]